MKLTKIKINNFRCIDEIEVNVYDYISLIGPNNCGKSAVLRAIEIFLNQTNPEVEEWRNSETDIPIVIEGIFDDIEEWERDTPGVAGIIHDNKIRLRLTISIDENNKIKQDFEAYVQEVNINGWADSWKDVSENIKSIADEMDINGTAFRNSSNKERLRQKIKDEHSDLVSLGEEKWTSENISIGPALKQALPQAVVVPAVRDACDDTKTTATTSFGILLKKIIVPAIQKSKEYQDFQESVEKLTARISGKGDHQIEEVENLAKDLTDRISTIIKTEVIVTLEKPDTDKFLGSNAIIRLNDGVETPIHLQGHGAQRALIFALIEVIAKQDAVVGEAESNNRSTILLFEEPELYLHPHLMRKLEDNLKNIASKPEWQVIVSTHSPFLIDVATNPRSLVVFQRGSTPGPPTKRQLDIDPFEEDDESKRDREALRAALNFHPTVNEAFFAKQVVLVEGDTEIAVFRHEKRLAHLANIDEEKQNNVTFVSCGGKWTIAPIAKLLVKFEIPFRIIHDMDRKDIDDKDIEKLPPIHPYKANKRIADVAQGAPIYIVEDTFEDTLWVAGENEAKRDKPYKAWQRIKELESLEEVPELKKIVLFAYDW